MARRDGTAGPLRRLATVVVALLVLGLVVVGGARLTAQAGDPPPTVTLAAGRTAVVCTTGSVPSTAPSASPSAPTPSASSPSAPSPSVPTPGTPTPAAPNPTPSGPAPSTPAPGTPAPSASTSPSAGAAAPGTVYAVASGPVGPGSAAPDGRLTVSRLGADITDLTVDEQGHGVSVPSADAPVLLLGEGAMATTASGAVLSSNATGPETGLEAAPCLPPTTSAWFPGVASGGADRTELVLSNPDDAQAELDLTFYGRRGRVVVPGSPGVVVAAHASRSISLTSLVDVEGPLSVQVQATVGRVSAVARRIRTSGDAPAGADWVVPAAAPALTAVVPAVPGDAGTRELVVTNPSSARASVTVQVLGLQGPYAPVGAESLTLAPESSGTVELSEGLAGGSAGVKVTSDQPVTAAVTATSARRGAVADLAVQAAAPALVRTGVSAVATSDDADAELVLSNGGGTDTPVRFDVLSLEGVVLRTDEVLVAANGSATRRLNSPAPSYVVLHVPDGSAVVGGVVLTSPDDGSVAGLATVPLTSPDVSGRAPQVRQDPEAGR